MTSLRVPLSASCLIVLTVALVGFVYVLFRLINSWGQWPGDKLTEGLRIMSWV